MENKMYTAIYRDFRPDSFEQLVGQDHIVRILKSQIASGHTGHAYLFCGTRGTGKTTTARILAKALNCENEDASQRPCCECPSCRAIRDGNFMDVIEIDAASNNGVDNIRELRESVKYPPAVGRNKVYIIDEVHMLSTEAFNALLKTLEEPPENVVFILATTEPQKLPATILSRCMRLDFRRVSEKVIISNMKMICDAKGLEIEPSALALIAVNADGSVRDSLSILEQCISTGENLITHDDVAELLGTAGEETMTELTDCVIKGDISSALLLLDKVINTGRDVKQFMKEWLAHFRNLLMAKYIENPENTLNMSLENVDRVKKQSSEISTELLNRGITELTKTISESRWSSHPRVMLEMCIVRLGAGQEVEKTTVFKNDGAVKDVPEVKHIQPETTHTAQKEPASDMAGLWKEIVRKAVGEKPMLIRIETRAKLIGMDENNFYVGVEDDVTAKIIKENGRDVLEEKMEQYYGKHLTLRLAKQKGVPLAKEQDDAEAIANQIKERFNVDVEIKP
jgi:DNA polymerase-3 subunit gamma/tau